MPKGAVVVLVHVRATWKRSEIERSGIGSVGVGKMEWDCNSGSWGLGAGGRIGCEQFMGDVFAVCMEHADQYLMYAMHQFAKLVMAVKEPAGEIQNGVAEQIDTVICNGIRDSVA